MKFATFLILAIGALMAVDGPKKDDPSKGDLDRLRGTWLTVSLVDNGKMLVDPKTAPNDGPAVKLAYEGTSG